MISGSGAIAVQRLHNVLSMTVGLGVAQVPGKGRARALNCEKLPCGFHLTDERTCSSEVIAEHLGHVQKSGGSAPRT